MPWMDILQAVRSVALKGSITAAAVAAEAGIKPSAASSWLGKFCRWGYVVRAGTAMGTVRWTRAYEITKFGRSYKPKEKARARLRIAGKDQDKESKR